MQAHYPLITIHIHELPEFKKLHHKMSILSIIICIIVSLKLYFMAVAPIPLLGILDLKR